MTNILVFGAGKSSAYLIKYLLEQATKYFWQVTVADADINLALKRVGDHNFGTASQLNIHEEAIRRRMISNASIVISLLPPDLHIVVAKDCILLKKHLITASYVSPEIRVLHEEARDAGLIFMNEIGLDPGIDHMSAMKIIDEVERLGGDIYSFKSYCGGLVAPACDTNPWHYKISWNPRNIVLAGKSGAHFLRDGIEKTIDYSALFHEIEKVKVPDFGFLSAYANRDSLGYQNLYGLQHVKTMLRATFRYEAFCVGWDSIVNLGLTNETDQHQAYVMTYKDWFMAVTANIKGSTPKERIEHVAKDSKQSLELLEWLGIYENEKINLPSPSSSADILLKRIDEKWAMLPNDRDMIVMHHEFEYGRKNIDAKLSSTLIVEGEDKTYTAMAKTVGLPMAIFAKNLLTGKVKNQYGVMIPISKHIYKPILKELSTYGIEFTELV